MEEELEQILLDQYHVSKHIGKRMKRARSLMGDDPLLIQFQGLNEKRTMFFESMIQNKQLMKKKKRKIKKRHHDLLARHPLVEMYKYAWMTTCYGYNIVIESFKGFRNLYRKNNNEKNDIKSK